MKWLPLDLVEYLDKPGQIYSEQNGGEYHLSLEQVKRLKKLQAHLIPFVNPEFYLIFREEWQIQKIPAHLVRFLGMSNGIRGSVQPFVERGVQFSHLTPAQVPYLIREQIKWLPLFLVEYLDKPEQIYSDQNGPAYALSLIQVQRLKEHQARLIPFVNPEFYHAFREKWQIQHIPVHLVKFLGSGDAGNNLQLVMAQFACLTPEQVHHLIPQQMKWLPLNSVEHLVDPAQIYSDQNGGENYLSLEQAMMLKEHQAGLIRYVNPAFYRMFKERWQIQNIPGIHMKWVTQEQMRDLTEEQRQEFRKQRLHTAADHRGIVREEEAT